MKVSIIVVTVNTPHLTRACLESVRKNTSVPYELIVVNNSRARAIRSCLRCFRDIRILQNSENRGYAKAANQGARAARGRFLCFLNSDTLVPPRWMERLLKAARQPKTGAVEPATNNRKNDVYRSRRRTRAVDEETVAFLDRNAVQRRQVFETARCLVGFCLLIPQDAMKTVGPFDERFFFGMEDIDYSLRLRLRGYRLIRARSVFVYHHWSASGRPDHRRRFDRQARRRFTEKWRALLGRSFSCPRDIFIEFNRRWPVDAAEPASHSAAGSRPNGPSARPLGSPASPCRIPAIASNSSTGGRSRTETE